MNSTGDLTSGKTGTYDDWWKTLFLFLPWKIHDRRFVMNSREKFLHDIGRFELHACGVDTRMAAEILVL